MLNKFDAEFEKLSYDAQKMVISLFRNGDYTAESLGKAMAEHGELIKEWAIRNQEAIKFTKQMATEMGVKFAITKETVKNFDLIQGMNADNLGKNIDNYIADIRRFGLQAKLEGRALTDIIGGVSDKFAELGRRASTEAYTGIRMADATVKQDFFNEAGIELYYYDGPSDGKTRDDCSATLANPKQATGWTINEIAVSATPFICRGGFNCRHEWMPFVKELDIKPVEK